MLPSLTYSQFITALKVLLPLSALGLLSTLFLVPRDLDLDAAIPFAQIELQKRLKNQQITAPFFSGQTEHGHSLILKAESAQPDLESPEETIVMNLMARINTISGDQYNVTANQGVADKEYQEIVLKGDVVMNTSADYTVKTSSMTFGLAEIRAESGNEIHASGPLGTFKAGRMALRPAKDTDVIYLFFTKGVKLIYLPKETTR